MFTSKNLLLYIVFFSLYGAANSSAVLAATKIDTPLNIEGATTIVAEEIFSLINKMHQL